MRQKRSISFGSILWTYLTFCVGNSIFAFGILCMLPLLLSTQNSTYIKQLMHLEHAHLAQFSFIIAPVCLYVGYKTVMHGLHHLRNEFIESYFGLQKSEGRVYKITLWCKKVKRFIK